MNRAKNWITFITKPLQYGTSGAPESCLYIGIETKLNDVKRSYLSCLSPENIEKRQQFTNSDTLFNLEALGDCLAVKQQYLNVCMHCSLSMDEMDRQTDRHTDRQTHRETNRNSWYSRKCLFVLKKNCFLWRIFYISILTAQTKLVKSSAVTSILIWLYFCVG